MFDWHAVIIGGGPAGLTAGLYLSRAGYKTLLLEKESFGGPMINYEMIENYPGYSVGIAGAILANEMLEQATKYGLSTEIADVSNIELYENSRCVTSSTGMMYTASVVIIAGGSRNKKLGVPGEKQFLGKGVFECAFCDGGHFMNKVVAVCGGGDAGVTEALYMAKLASKVILLEAMPMLTACSILKDRVAGNSKIEVRCGMKVDSILGDDHVNGIKLQELQNGQVETLKVDGVLVHIGLEPNTEYVSGILKLDKQGQIVVNDKMQTEVPYIFAAGDIRSGSPRQIVTAVGDGASAAIAAQRLLQEIIK